jgi:hypothetical protein
MTIPVIITFCTLLLIAYLFDQTASKTRIPSVILLLILGWGVRQVTTFLDLPLPDLSTFLPILGTIGLILIVLEGSLELELNKSKIGLIGKSIFGALFQLVLLATILSTVFYYFSGHSYRDSLLNAIPFCIISSAIAIPSVKFLTKSRKEFVIYESSLSDILGVIFFNFIAHHESFGFNSFAHFGFQIVIITVISFVATIGLSFLLNKIESPIKFVPIILLIILIYTVSEIYHLPALIFILVFGLFIGNLDELKIFKFIDRFQPETLNLEVRKFKELTIEGAFLIRSLFFLLFGYLLETNEILNLESLKWAAGIATAIVIIRAIQLYISKLPIMPLLFVAPRGLITILLFLTIVPEQSLPFVNNSLIIQVILITALLMMFGLMITSKKLHHSEQTQIK